MRKLHKQLHDDLADLKANAAYYSLLDENEREATKEWYRLREKRIIELQEEFEPLIYRYFDLTKQEIALVEDTVRVYIPSSTPTSRWSTQTVTLDPLEDTAVEPYSAMGLKAYANTLTETLNSWAYAEGSEYRVGAEGGTDDRTGMSMVTLFLARHKEDFKLISPSQRLFEVLKEFKEGADEGHGTLLYERDIFFFQGNHVHIIRPHILMNWTRTTALNDASRIYGDIALAREAS